MGFAKQLAVYRNHRIASDDTAVGMIVDASTIVTENADKLIQQGMKLKQSVYGLKSRENKMKKFLSPGAF